LNEKARFHHAAQRRCGILADSGGKGSTATTRGFDRQLWMNGALPQNRSDDRRNRH
jgi:hypothetical protein